MILILLISVSLCMVAWRIGYYCLWDRELYAMLSFGQPYAYAGESAELTEIVENHKRVPVYLMEIGFQM